MSDKEKIAKQADTISTLEQEVPLLKEHVKKLEKMLFGRKSEKLKVLGIDPNQLVIPLGEEAKTTEPDGVETISIPAHKRLVKKQAKRLEIPEHLPRVEEVIEPNVDLTDAVKIGEEITEVLAHKPAQLYVRRIIRPKYLFKKERTETPRIVVADLPSDLPFPRSNIDASVATHFAISKFIDHLPVHRILEQYKRLQIFIPQSTAIGWMKKMASLLDPLYESLKQHIKKSTYLQVDESPIKVMDKERAKGKTHQGYMWCYHSVVDRLVLFDYAPSRGKQEVNRMLAHFEGYLQTDGYAAYDFLAKKEGITARACWAHVRRKFVEAQSNDKARATHALKEIGSLYQFERLASERSAEEKYELRQQYSKPIVEALELWAREEITKVLPKSAIGKALAYMLNLWNRLLVYLEDGILEIDNNFIENKIRPLAIGRKNYLFAGHPNGAKWAAMFYSFFATATLNGIQPHVWLQETLEKIATHPISRIEELLPIKKQ